MFKKSKNKGRAIAALVIILILSSSVKSQTSMKPSKNKETVMRYMEGFNASDHKMILSCLTDSVIWEMPGLFHLKGKSAFDKEIENPAFTGRPTIVITRLIEEGAVVVAEGTVKGNMKGAGPFTASFCDVFHFSNGNIEKLTSYLVKKE